jgi:hypothetical protein
MRGGGPGLVTEQADGKISFFEMKIKDVRLILDELSDSFVTI